MSGKQKPPDSGQSLRQAPENELPLAACVAVLVEVSSWRHEDDPLGLT